MKTESQLLQEFKNKYPSVNSGDLQALFFG